MPTVTQTLRALAEDIPTVIRSGDVANTKRVKTQLENLKKELNKVIGVFDHTLVAAQTGFAGDDFLVEIVEDPDNLVPQLDDDGEEIVNSDGDVVMVPNVIRRPIATIVQRENRGRKPKEIVEDPNDFL